MFKSEKTLLLVSAILGIVGIAVVFLSELIVTVAKNSTAFTDAMQKAGLSNIATFNASYWIHLVLSIIAVVLLFVIRSKVNFKNNVIMGVVLIIGGFLCFLNILGWITNILAIIAGIMIAAKKEPIKSAENTPANV